MANVSDYNMECSQVGTIELNDAIFGVNVNEHLTEVDTGEKLRHTRERMKTN